MIPQQSCRLELQLVPLRTDRRERVEGGGRKCRGLRRTDRRLSHSGIFFRRGGFSEARFLTGRPLDAIVRFKSRRGGRNSRHPQCPPGHAQCPLHCEPTIGSRQLENFDLFYGPTRTPGGGVSNSGEMRARTGRLGTRIFSRNSENFCCNACRVLAAETSSRRKT